MRLTRLARWCHRNRRLTVGLWVAALLIAGAIGNRYAAETVDNFELPGTDSQQAYDSLEERFPSEAGDSGHLVFASPDGFDAGEQAHVARVLDRAAGLDHVVATTDPFSPGAEFQRSPDGTIAFGTVVFDTRASEVPREVGEALVDLAASSDTDSVTVEAGGAVVEFVEQGEPGASEAIGIVAAIFILLVAFGSLLAMGLPIGTALIGIGIGLSIVALLGHLLDVPSFAAQVAAMIGIGVGIDYALFIVTRYRTALAHGKNPEEATVEAIGTAGRAVVFAGAVVVLALMSMLVMDFVVVRGVALSASSVVLVTMLASVTLLPALLGFAGTNVNRFRLPFLAHTPDAAAARRSVWFRWSRLVQRRPGPIALVGVLLLVGLSLPLLGMRLGVADAGNGNTEKTSRRAYDLLADGFGVGFNGPFLVVVDAEGAADGQAFEQAEAALRATEGIAAVTPAQVAPGGETAVITAFPETAPQDEATEALLARIRGGLAPEIGSSTGAQVHVGGVTASFVDFGDKIGERLPIFIAVVIVLSFLLLMAVFRSILVAVKAAVLNLLSITAAYGVIVAVFQWGWLSDVFGVGRPGPIESWVPMMMFAILFGLSMDYEVFLISRIREEYVRTGDNGVAVADGLASTARVITAAAAIMISVFMSFVLGDERALKLIGLGLASAIFVDATLVRLVLVPSTMELLGDRNWWLPRWLDRLIPHFHIEGDESVSSADVRPAIGDGAPAGDTPPPGEPAVSPRS